ncbi:hypothetical protein PTKIN_Ptkin02bG0021200 [Pterospermum kingtungense]
MENLMKQMRGRFSGAREGKTDESSSIRNQRIPPQKTQSFKGERRTQNWFQKQFYGKMMSSNHDSNHSTEQVVGVAAATYAINLIADQKKTGMGLEPSLVKDKSRKEDTTFSILKPGIVSEQLTGEGSKRSSESAESKGPVINATDEKATRPAPSFKKTLTFADQLGITSNAIPRSSTKPITLSSQPESAAPKPDIPSIKPEREAPNLVSPKPKPDHTVIKPETAATIPEQLPSIKPVAPGVETQRQSAERTGTEQTEADTWEKAEVAKINQRYAKLNSIILAWEEKKKKKARNKLDKAESQLEHKRARALIKFKNEMEYIKQAADGARARAETRQRNDELKAKEKANIIRTTGELPKTCFCC